MKKRAAGYFIKAGGALHVWGWRLPRTRKLHHGWAPTRAEARRMRATGETVVQLKIVEVPARKVMR